MLVLETKQTQERKMNTTLNAVSKSLVKGARLSVADQAGELCLDVASKFLPPELSGPALDTELGREVTKAATASAIIFACNADLPVGSPALKSRVKEVCGEVVTASTYNAARPFLGELRGKFETLAGLGNAE